MNRFKSFFESNFNNKASGGAIFIKKALNLEEIQLNERYCFDSIRVKISFQRSIMKIRSFQNSPENKDTQFLEELEGFLDELKIDHHTVCLGSDSNFDLLKDKQSVKNYVAICESFSIKHVNMETATRVNETSET